MMGRWGKHIVQIAHPVYIEDYDHHMSYLKGSVLAKGKCGRLYGKNQRLLRMVAGFLFLF